MSEPSLAAARQYVSRDKCQRRNASFTCSVRSVENAEITTIDDNSSTNDKSTRKFFTTWRSACDRTKVRTKELLKRTLSWKGGNDYTLNEMTDGQQNTDQSKNGTCTGQGWSVHVWTTWVRRSTSLHENTDDEEPIVLSKIQMEKFSHFFYTLLDLDRDDLISIQDFDQFSERLRRFADWNTTSGEFSRLKQVQQEFVNTFFNNAEESDYLSKGYIQLEDWLRIWGHLLKNIHRMNELPFWLQQLPKILFLVMNRSGSGELKLDELKTFLLSVIGVRNTKDNDVIQMYKSMTSNGDFKLKYPVYELCFANWLLCKNPNGPGQWLFGKCGQNSDFFPIDYSALNTSTEDLETYQPDVKTNRHSIIV